MGCKMKNKISLFTIIIILTLSAGAISTPTSQPPTEQTTYEVDKTWHLGTLNFTVGPLLVYNITFTDDQLEFTEEVFGNNTRIEIPAEITCNPKFISPFSLPIYIKWELKGTDASGSGAMICFPNGRVINDPHNNIRVYFPRDETNWTVYLYNGYIHLAILHHIPIPNAPRYTLYLRRVNSSNNSAPNPNPSPNWNWIGENFVYYVDNSSYINISKVDNSLFRMNIRNLLENLQGFRLIYTFAADSGDNKLDNILRIDIGGVNQI